VTDPLPAPAPVHVLIVDDEPLLLGALTEVITRLGHRVTACADAASARAHALDPAAEFAVLLTDFNLGGEDGAALIESLHGACPALVGVIITGNADTAHAVQSMRAGAFDFVSKPIAVDELRRVLARACCHHQALRENAASRAALRLMAETRGRELDEVRLHLETAYQFMLESLVSMLESRERDSGAHTMRVATIALILGRELGLEGDELETLRRGAYLHDIGKVAIPDAILLKPGPLDPDEWRTMQTHVEAGYRILRSNPYLADVAELVRSHHEHVDGSGYPRGLRGEEIMRGARVFAVADAYDAIRARRPYSAAQSEEETIRRICAADGTQFDPAVVAALLRARERVDQAWLAAAKAVGTVCPPVCVEAPTA